MKCKIIPGSQLYDSWNKNTIYNYEINEIDDTYNHHIYENNHLIATFSEEYFNINFIDIKKERIKKLKQLNER